MLSRDLVAASSKPMVLSILADGESYGYEIIQKVRALSDEKIEWTDGMMYPVLHRLIHSDSDSPDHGCIITMFTKGQLLPAPDVQIFTGLALLFDLK
jgi:hypothetical protein